MLRPALLTLFAFCACRSGRAGSPAGDGELEAHWADSTRVADFRAPAEATWCPRDTSLEILAVRNDSAVGLALYARDSLRAQRYPVFPAGMFAPGRTQATGAVRLLTATGLRGLESTRGVVEVTQGGAGVGARVSGIFDFHLKQVNRADSLHLTGRFTRLAIRPALSACGRAAKPATP